MSGTTFCDSAGVHAIVTAHRQITKTRTQLRLVAMAVLRIFKLVGADQLIPTYPNPGAALTGPPGALASQRDRRNEPGPQRS